MLSPVLSPVISHGLTRARSFPPGSSRPKKSARPPEFTGKGSLGRGPSPIRIHTGRGKPQETERHVAPASKDSYSGYAHTPPQLAYTGAHKGSPFLFPRRTKSVFSPAGTNLRGFEVFAADHSPSLGGEQPQAAKAVASEPLLGAACADPWGAGGIYLARKWCTLREK